VLLHQDLGEALQVLIGLALVPEEQVLQSTALELEVELDGDQLQVWLAGAGVRSGGVQAGGESWVLVQHLLVELGLVVGRLEQGELGDVRCVHPRLVGHEGLQVVLDGLGDLHLVALDLALKPEAEAGVVDAYGRMRGGVGDLPVTRATSTCFTGYLFMISWSRALASLSLS